MTCDISQGLPNGAGKQAAQGKWYCKSMSIVRSHSVKHYLKVSPGTYGHTLAQYSLRSHPCGLKRVISGQPDLTEAVSPNCTPLCSEEGDTSGREREEEGHAGRPATSEGFPREWG